MPTAVAPATSASGLSPIIRIRVGVADQLEGDLEHGGMGLLVAGDRRGQDVVDQVTEAEPYDEVVELGHVVADDDVPVAAVSEPQQCGPGVVEHRPVRRVDVDVAHLRGGQAGGLLVGAGEDVRAAQGGVECAPPPLGCVQLRVGHLGTVPGEAVPQSCTQQLQGHSVTGGDVVECRQQGGPPVAVASHQGAVEVPQDRGNARRRASGGGRAQVVDGSHHLDPPGRKGSGSCGGGSVHGGSHAIHLGSKAP